jgi:hypothetical protein
MSAGSIPWRRDALKTRNISAGDREQRLTGRIVAHVATLYAGGGPKGVATRKSVRCQRVQTMSTHHHLRSTIFGALALALAAVPAFAADPVFPVNSRVGLVPPAGFVPNARLSGFENPQANAVILMSTMPADAYPELEKSLTDEALKQRGIQVALREPLALKGGKGLFIAGPREADGQKRYEGVVIAALDGVATFISVQMLEASHATVTDAMLREAFKTLAVRKEVPDSEKLSILPYKINNLAGFRVLRTAIDGSAILTEGPKDAVKNVEQPFLLIGVKVGEAPKPEERDKFARELFSGAPGIKEVKITRAEPLRIGQMAGYEIVADAKDLESGTDVTTVQWLRFGQNGHLQMYAIVRRTAWHDVYPKLRAIRDNIELTRSDSR